MDEASLSSLPTDDLVIAAMCEALAQLEAGDLASVKVLLEITRQHVAIRAAANATHH